MKAFLKKFLSISVFVTIYFIAIIPAREFAMDSLVSKFEQVKSNEIIVQEKGARGMTIKMRGSDLLYKARVPFGMNFFIGIIGLIMISASRKFFLIEVGVQILFGIIIFSSFLYGVKGHSLALQIADMSSIYFLPLSSLFMVVLGFIEKKSRLAENEV